MPHYSHLAARMIWRKSFLKIIYSGRVVFWCCSSSMLTSNALCGPRIIVWWNIDRIIKLFSKLKKNLLKMKIKLKVICLRSNKKSWNRSTFLTSCVCRPLPDTSTPCPPLRISWSSRGPPPPHPAYPPSTVLLLLRVKQKSREILIFVFCLTLQYYELVLNVVFLDKVIHTVHRWTYFQNICTTHSNFLQNYSSSIR